MSRRSLVKRSWRSVADLVVDPSTYTSLLRKAGESKSLQELRRLHQQLERSGHLESLLHLLLEMYGKCGSVAEAKAIFDRMGDRTRMRKNAFPWNLMLGAYCSNGFGQQALDLFTQMVRSHGVEPDRVTYIHALTACCQVRCLQEGKALHDQFIASALESSLVLESALVNMYGRCGSVRDACKVFESMPIRNVICWNTMIAVYAQNGHMREAIEVFYKMQASGMRPERVTFLNVLAACCSRAYLEDGRRIHCQAVDASLDTDKFVGNALVSMYAKCRSMEDAKQVFDKLPVKDVVSWNALLMGYVQLGQNNEAYQVFNNLEVEPDEVTLTIVLGAFNCPLELENGRSVHAQVQARGLKSVVLDTALLSMYGRCGSVEDAKGVFDKMELRSGVTWNAVITMYAQHGYAHQALHLFRSMKEAGFAPDLATFMGLLPACSSLDQLKEVHREIASRGFQEMEPIANVLIISYSKCSSLNDAESVFLKIRNCQVSVVCWTCMIAAYVEHGFGDKGLRLFWEMAAQGVKADTVAFVCALDACSGIDALAEGKVIQGLAEEMGLVRDVFVATAVVNMHGKCGNLEEARRVFEGMERRNVVSWNSMVGSYAQHGHTREALDLYEYMELEGTQPDSVTFICILFACSHLGLMDRGRELFVSMVEDYNIEAAAAHYSCMVDLLSRAGWVKEAEELIGSMPLQPGASAWTALLGACSFHSDVERAARAAHHVHHLDPRRVAPFLLLSKAGQTTLNRS